MVQETKLLDTNLTFELTAKILEHAMDCEQFTNPLPPTLPDRSFYDKVISSFHKDCC